MRCLDARARARPRPCAASPPRPLRRARRRRRARARGGGSPAASRSSSADERRALALAQIAADGLARRRRIAERAEQIVAELEGDAERRGEALERCARSSALAPARRRADQERAARRCSSPSSARASPRRSAASPPRTSSICPRTTSRCSSREQSRAHPGRRSAGSGDVARAPPAPAPPRDRRRGWPPRRRATPSRSVARASACTLGPPRRVVVAVHPVVVDEQVRLEQLDGDAGGHDGSRTPPAPPHASYAAATSTARKRLPPRSDERPQGLDGGRDPLPCASARMTPRRAAPRAPPRPRPDLRRELGERGQPASCTLELRHVRHHRRRWPSRAPATVRGGERAGG